MSAPELSVVVFAYDEADNVQPMLDELCAWLDQHEPASEIVFVDDGSRDDSCARARAALAGRQAVILRHAQNLGIGAALKSGVRGASGSWVTFLPADGQIEPAAIGTLRAAARHGAEVVLSVYDARHDGLHRKLLSWGVRALIALVHQVELHSDGPYLFRRELFDPARLEADTFFLNFEFPIRVLRAGLPHRTVTIRCRPRRTGRSKSTGLRRIWGVFRDLVALRQRLARESHARRVAPSRPRPL